jgi:hypothetical protein
VQGTDSRVVSYCKRHLAQEGKLINNENYGDSKSYISLKNWCLILLWGGGLIDRGHDSLKGKGSKGSGATKGATMKEAVEKQTSKEFGGTETEKIGEGKSGKRKRIGGEEERREQDEEDQEKDQKKGTAAGKKRNSEREKEGSQTNDVPKKVKSGK